MSDHLEPDAITPEVIAALRGLVPADALTRALRPMTRSPGHLSWSHAVVSEEELHALLGFSPLRLPASGVTGKREVFTVRGRNGEPLLERSESGPLFVSSFAVFHLPASLTWRSARRSSVLRSDVVALYVAEADERDWPQQMGQRWVFFDADGSPVLPGGMTDFAVVTVAGTSVGVQVDVSGATALGWSLRRVVRGADRWWNVELHARWKPEEALRLLHDAGLFR